MRVSRSMNPSMSILLGSIAVWLAACARGSQADHVASGSGGGAACSGNDGCAGGTSSSASTSSTSSSTSSSSSGPGGACPDGNCACEPGSVKSCYDGPEGTEGVGPCHAGTATCDSMGQWGACDGEVVPSANECTPGDCNGVVCPGGTPLRGATPSGNGTSVAEDVATDASGNVFVTGLFTGTVDFGCGPMTSAGSSDGFLVEFSPALTCIWSKPFGSSIAGVGSSVAVDSAGDVIVTGGFEDTADLGGVTLTTGGGYDVLLAKLAPNGQLVWSKRFGGAATQEAFAVAVDGSGDVFVTGLQDGPTDFGKGPVGGQTFLAKLDPSGAPVWSRGFQAFGDCAARGLAVDASGNVALSGWFKGTLDFGAGALASSGPNDDDMYVAKLDGNGSALWSKRFGDVSTNQYATQVAFDAAGDLVMAGYLAGAADFGGGWLSASSPFSAFAAKLDANGNHVWSKVFGGAGDVRGLAVDAAGDVLLTGTFAPTIDLGGGPLTSASTNADVYFAKLDPSGSHLYSASFGTSDVDDSEAVALDGAGHVFMTGSYYGHTIDFGAGPLTSTASPALFVAEFAP